MPPAPHRSILALFWREPLSTLYITPFQTHKSRAFWTRVDYDEEDVGEAVVVALAGEDPDDGAGEAADQDAEPLQYTRAMVSSCRTPRYFVWKLL